MKKRLGIVGSGPAALMAADVLSTAGQFVTVFEKRKSIGRKLLVAGSSGLNITNGAPLEEFAQYYSGGSRELWPRILQAFSPRNWIDFIESLGFETFEGTSGRYFIEEMKASGFLRAWNKRLIDRGVEFRFGKECLDFAPTGEGCILSFADGTQETLDSVCFALGGASWEPGETPLRWPGMFKKHGLVFEDFTPSNVGYRVKWKEAFIKEAERQPLKSIILKSPRGMKKGDAMITDYGIEGTPVYFVGRSGPVTIDLKPDLTAAQIVQKLKKVKENHSPIRRVRKQLGLCPAAFALVFHHTPADLMEDRSFERLAAHLKNFPLTFGEPQPLTEAISSAGGLSLEEVDETFMLKRFPGFYAAGEMLAWDAPTGGFLIQASVSQGFSAARGMLARLSSRY